MRAPHALRQSAKAVIAAIEEQAEGKFTKKSRKRFLASAGPWFLVLTFIEDGEQSQHARSACGVGSQW